MPRIDPLQLLKCLSVLLSPEGGILSRNEVPRLVSLMTKFSKKLVSKCVYVLILKNTETSLVDMFMAENGWTLVQSWLQDAVPTGNWDLVKEILELLLVTPVDVDRLKLNCLPKLIKSLTRKEGQPEIARLSDRIVQNWLMIVKGSASSIAASGPALVPVPMPKIEAPELKVEKNETKLEPIEPKKEADEVIDENTGPIKPDSFYKLTVKDGKQVIKKLSVEKDNEKDETDKKNDKEKSSKSSSSSRSKSSSSSRDKDRSKSSSRSGSSSSKSGSSSSSRDKSRDKDRDRKDKDRKGSSSKSSPKSSHSSSSSSSSRSKDKKDSREKSKDSKDSKENQTEKDKDALDKLLNPKPFKSARIPKLSSNDKPKENKPDEKPKENKPEPEVKKPSYSILNRKSTGEERGKTVKVFNSKMRSTGLEEIAKPPPKRSSKKPTPSIQLPTIPLKRPSPPRESLVPPEKKIKIDKVDKPDRPGAIKLIAPKPKPILLQESDMFSDALTAAAPKKDPKKRKRRLSSTKEATESTAGDAPTPTSPSTPSSPTTLKNIAPINFYQDTLSEQSEKSETEKEEEADADEENNDENIPKSPTKDEDDDDDEETRSDSPTADIKIKIENENMPSPAKQIKLEIKSAGELKGILVHEKKQSVKRSIQWKPEKDLVETRYFELDETERINVTKTFTDMAKMDIDGEREAMINSRISSDDKMAPAIKWYAPFLCDELKSLIVPGTKSLEKDIQFAREKQVPAAEYFNKRMIPDNPKEPEIEVHQKIDPFCIPLEDPEGHVIDLSNKPWPESKGFDPKMEIQQQMPPMFPGNNMPFNPNFNNMPPAGVQFVGVPQRFPGPGPMMGPANFQPPHMMHNNMMVPQMNQPDMMNGGQMNPAMFAPGPDGFMGVPNEQPYPMPQFNGGPQGPMYVPNNFRGANNGGRGGGFRRGGGGGNGGGGWVQVNGPRPWKRGSGPHRGSNRPCKNIQNHGYCRNLDSCPFRH
ncbi:unnamed protein product [Ceutorhynchus assimilis]|uniref:Serine/threonine-protein phosphatase 1 regulatory subunit 10 n=1 Tax=Ceutorhynchus assimilis TaxID=467358 RepID=A0A9N9MW68_9CUCU|nr:unnamed protein product [Ceutorhynchus assimilis]